MTDGRTEAIAISLTLFKKKRRGDKNWNKIVIISYPSV